jgi:hypothetical protein
MLTESDLCHKRERKAERRRRVLYGYAAPKGENGNTPAYKILKLAVRCQDEGDAALAAYTMSKPRLPAFVEIPKDSPKAGAVRGLISKMARWVRGK